MDVKALQELQTKFDLALWHANRSLVKIILLAQNDSSVPASAFYKALERVREVRSIIGQLETWLVDQAPESEQV